jgi:hypothetical protein
MECGMDVMPLVTNEDSFSVSTITLEYQQESGLNI